MIIYLSHPIHGTKVAISETEADYDKKSGWAEYRHDDADARDESTVISIKRRGRPPKVAA